MYSMHTQEPEKAIKCSEIKGFGEKEELVVSRMTISPPNPPIFRIIQVDKVVTITNYKLIPISDSVDAHSCWRAKVIIDGVVDKNVLYKTISAFTDVAVGGPVFQFTTKIDFATFIVVTSSQPILSTDHVEIIEAYVEGENEELLNPNTVAVGAPDFAITYNTLLEKMLIKIKLKISKQNHCCRG